MIPNISPKLTASLKIHLAMGLLYQGVPSSWDVLTAGELTTPNTLNTLYQQGDLKLQSCVCLLYVVSRSTGLGACSVTECNHLSISCP
jgi:hypothetical protein